MAFTVTTPAFADGQPVPREFTCDGNDAPPAMTVADPPQGTKSFAIIMDDPDAPKGTFTHWLAYDIPADAATLRATAGNTVDRARRRAMGPIAITSPSTPSTCLRSRSQAAAAATSRPRSRVTPWPERSSWGGTNERADGIHVRGMRLTLFRGLRVHVAVRPIHASAPARGTLRCCRRFGHRADNLERLLTVATHELVHGHLTPLTRYYARIRGGETEFQVDASTCRGRWRRTSRAAHG
jgi:hypothetical protein